MEIKQRVSIEIWAFYIFDVVDVVYFQQYDYVPVPQFDKMVHLSYVLLF